MPATATNDLIGRTRAARGQTAPAAPSQEPGPAGAPSYRDAIAAQRARDAARAAAEATEALLKDLDAQRDRADWAENQLRAVAAAAGLPELHGSIRSVAHVVAGAVRDLADRARRLEQSLLDRHAAHAQRPAADEPPAPPAASDFVLLTHESAHCRPCDRQIPADHLIRKMLPLGPADTHNHETLSAYCDCCRRVYCVTRVLIGGEWRPANSVRVITAGPHFDAIKAHVEQLDGTLRYSDEDSQVDPREEHERAEKAAVLSRDDRFAPV